MGHTSYHIPCIHTVWHTMSRTTDVWCHGMCHGMWCHGVCTVPIHMRARVMGGMYTYTPVPYLAADAICTVYLSCADPHHHRVAAVGTVVHLEWPIAR